MLAIDAGDVNEVNQTDDVDDMINYINDGGGRGKGNRFGRGYGGREYIMNHGPRESRNTSDQE